AACNLALRVGEDLAVLGGEDLREVLAVLVHELPDAEEDLGAAGERDRAPGRERLLRGLDSLVDLLGAGKVDLTGLGSTRRVVDRAVSTRRSCGRCAADPMGDALDLARASGVGRLRDFRHPSLLVRPEEPSAGRPGPGVSGGL